jgi:hypothetical protein
VLLKKFVDLKLLFFRKFNIFGLDAPFVIVLWHQLIECEFKLQINPEFKVILFLSVWLAYSADRYLDDNNIFLKKKLQERHLIFKNKPFGFYLVWIILFTTAVALTFIYFKRVEICISLIVLVLVISNQILSIFESKKLNKNILKPFRTSIILTIGCFIYPCLHLKHYDYSFIYFPTILCIVFLGNCMAVNNLKVAHFDTSHSPILIIRDIFIMFLLVLLGFYFIGLTPFVIAAFLSVSSIPLIFLKSKISYDDRRVILDQIFWVIPLVVLILSFAC